MKIGQSRPEDAGKKAQVISFRVLLTRIFTFLLTRTIMINNSNSHIWPNVLALTQKQIGSERFNLWFKNVKMPFYGNNTANIVVPNIFVKSWFDENFSALLKDNIQAVTDAKVNLKISVDGNSFDNEDVAEQPKQAGQDNNVNDKQQTGAQRQQPPGRELTLDEYVVGPCNRMAHASALELIKPDNHSFNLLFIHGSVGVGKTHMLQGIYNKIRSENNGIKAAYLPAEAWTNEFIGALRNNKLETFRSKYRNLDVLLIDDVHFVANKQGVQEELLHTFNILHGLSKKIVFASDSHPKFINKLKESLASRFMAGLVAKIETPDIETARAIVNAKLKKIKKEFPAAVIEYIAGTFINSIRELECALTTVLAVSNINKRRVDITMAKDALEDNTPKKKKITTSFKDIENVVLKHYDITSSELHSNKRTTSVTLPRHITMYLGSTMTNLSRQQIGDHLGGKKHATVIHAVKKIKEKACKDADLREQIAMLKEEIRRG